MKTRAVIAMILLSLCSAAPWAEAATSPSPSSVTLSTNRPGTLAITWTLTMTAPPTSSTSTSGEFRPIPDEQPFYTQNTSLTADFNGDVATVRESLTIPGGVIKKAQELGLKQFIYFRSFPGVDGGSGYVTIRLTAPSAVVPLNITHMRLYFENKRAEITVKRKQPGLKAFADINFTGKGLLKGYWQVDDRIIAQVNKDLSYGKSLTLATPDMPSLPTFAEGTHVVKLIIQSPDQGIEFPKALYHVTPPTSTETVAITLVNPFNLAVLERESPVFEWQAAKPLPVYLVEFMENENGEPVFSVYTTQPRYLVPDMVLKNYLKSPQPYYWRVTGLDKENNIAGESEVRQVRFKT